METLTLASNTETPRAETCIMCMRRPAAPHNGGLCSSCAPPLKVKVDEKRPSNHEGKIKIKVIRLPGRKKK